MKSRAYELNPTGDGNPAKTLVRTYRGSEAQAMEAYRRDAAGLAQDGYHPTSQVWAPGTWGCGAFLFAFLLCVILVGIIVLIYMVIVKPAGVLTVTYQLQQINSPRPAVPPPIPSAPVDTKICPQCAEEVKAAAKICRFCSHSFTCAASSAESGII